MHCILTVDHLKNMLSDLLICLSRMSDLFPSGNVIVALRCASSPFISVRSCAFYNPDIERTR